MVTEQQTELSIVCEIPELISPLQKMGVKKLFTSLPAGHSTDVLFAPYSEKVLDASAFLKVIVHSNWSNKELIRAKSDLNAFALLELNSSGMDIFLQLESLLNEIKIQIHWMQTLHDERERNKILSLEHADLSEVLQSFVSLNRESLKVHKEQNRNLKKNSFFLKRLNEAAEMSEILAIIREESKTFRGLGDPILVIHQKGRSQVLFFQNRAIAEKRMDIEFSNSQQWRQQLANILARPMGPILSLEVDQKVALLFEHQMSGEPLDKVQREWSGLLGAVAVSVERLRLDQDLREASFFWEKTFDGLDEPIGILDSQNRVIRGNRPFQPDLLTDLTKETIRRNGRVYHLQKYPIKFGEDVQSDSRVVHFSDQTAQFQLKQHMIQTEKIAALGQLAGHIAHELNNPLTGIRSLCQLLSSDLNVPEAQREDLKEVERASERCQRIITNLLEYSKPNSSGSSVLTEVNEVVNNTLPFLKTLLGFLNVDLQLSSKELWSLVDPHMLQQVVFNLIANACHAMGKRGQLSIRSSLQGKFIQIEIEDSGGGIREEIREQIFDPFFTTKPAGEGTGLGLSFSRNFLRSCGGDLILKKSDSTGSNFVIQLPHKEEPA